MRCYVCGKLCQSRDRSGECGEDEYCFKNVDVFLYVFRVYYLIMYLDLGTPLVYKRIGQREEFCTTNHTTHKLHIRVYKRISVGPVAVQRLKESFYFIENFFLPFL